MKAHLETSSSTAPTAALVGVCSLVVLMLGLVFASPATAQGREASATQSVAGITEEITTATTELAAINKRREDKAKEAADNESQMRRAEAANDNEAVVRHKNRAAVIGDELNRLDGERSAKNQALDGMFARLRVAARKELVQHVKSAATVAATDENAAKELLRSASSAYDEWKRGIERWTIYQHSEEELVQPSQLAANRARAESERERLRAGLLRLESERELEATELADIETVLAGPVAHGDWDALQKKLEALKKSVTDRKADIDSRVKSGQQRLDAIEKYLKS